MMKIWIRILILATLFPFVAVLAFISAWFFLVFAPFLLFPIALTTVTLGLLAYRMHFLHQAKRARVLLIDDEPSSLILIQSVLKAADVDFQTISNASDAVDEMTKNHYRWIFLDYSMPKMSGSDVLVKADQVCSESVKEHPLTSVIGYTGLIDQEWNLPSLNYFQVIKSLNKRASPSKLRRELELIGVLNAHV